MRISLRSLFLFTIIFSLSTFSYAQSPGASSAGLGKDPLERCLWYNAEKTAKIQIYKAVDGKFYGKIVWLKVPDIDGKPKTDSHNPDKAKQSNPILGLMLLTEMKKVGDNKYEDGKVYDPKNGKTYSCIITDKGESLDLRGYIGFSFIGRSTTWTKAD